MRVAHLVLAAALLTLVAACNRHRDAQGGPHARRMRDAIPRIEAATGLTFRTPPKLEVRTRAQVREFLVNRFNESSPAAQLRGEEMAYKLFGLLPESLDLRQFLLELLTEQIVGYYDPATKVLYIVEDAPNDIAGITVTHELIHALQDQYLDLDSIQKSNAGSDRQVAAQAVLEGQATYEQMTMMLGGDLAARIGGWDRVRDVIRESQTAMPVFSSAPMAIQESLLFPYLSGAEFVRRFKERNPEGNLLADLPVSTEQVLSAEAFFGEERDAPVAIQLPPGQNVEHEQGMGEFGTRLVLYQHLRDASTSAAAARGWDGDRYRVFLVGGRRALAWVTVWDTGFDAAQFVDAMGEATRLRLGADAATVAGRTRTYRGTDRTVALTQRELGGRNVVLYVDVPAGASTSVLNLSQVRLDP